MTLPNRPDPFAPKRPSVSFKGAAPGTTIRLSVEGYPEQVQSRDFETGGLATWPDGNPKMAGVINGTVNGQPMAVWASLPSALASAISHAQASSGITIGPGVDMLITFTHEEPNANPRLSPAKQYKVDLLRVGSGAPAGDPFGKAAEAPPVVHYAPPQQSYAQPQQGFAQPQGYAPPQQQYVPQQQPPAGPALRALTPEQYAAMEAVGVDMTLFTTAVSA